MELNSLEKLIPILSANKVMSFQSGELKISFWSPAIESVTFKEEIPEHHAKKPEPTLTQSEITAQTSLIDSAPKLNDELMQFDDILHWSDGSSETPLPLTGQEQPIGVSKA